jgi:hypothetical protein
MSLLFAVTCPHIRLQARACSLPITFFQKWALVQMSPLLMSGGIIIAYALSAVRCRRRRTALGSRRGGALRSYWRRYVNMIVGGISTVFFYLFFVLLRGGVEVFDCTPPDARGRAVLQAEPSVTCWTDAHYALIPWGAASLVAYGLGVPGVFAWMLWRHRAAMERDVSMWAMGEGNTEETNGDYWVRRRYGRLYLDYEPRYFYWKLVLLLRKAFLVVVTIMWSSNPMFQAACALAIMITAYSMHTRAMPFLRTTTVLKRSGLQDRLAAAARSRARWAGTAVNAVLTSGRRQLFDLNALEATMLRAAIAVLLGGMMVRK